MRRAALHHPKMHGFSSCLEIPQVQAIGHIELLIDFVATNSPRGDVGKFADGSIARGCQWSGDPARFIRALVDSGWLDEDSQHRLLMHDWAENCEQWVKLKIQKLKTGFAVPTAGPIAVAVAGAIAIGPAVSIATPITGQSELTAIAPAVVSASRALLTPIPTLDPTPTPTAAEQAGITARFVKPTPEEVQSYCDERHNGISGEEFCDHYESTGWMIGKNHMKDWKPAVRTWERRRNQNKKSPGQSLAELC